MISETYNSLIDAFSTNFDRFSFNELASFTQSLGRVGLRQLDIISEIIEKIRISGGKIEAVKEGDADVETYYTSFNKVIYPIFKTIVDLNA